MEATTGDIRAKSVAIRLDPVDGTRDCFVGFFSLRSKNSPRNDIVKRLIGAVAETLRLHDFQTTNQFFL